jgi:hypothetical protein
MNNLKTFVPKEIITPEEEKYSEMYLLDPKIEKKIEGLISSEECQDLISKAKENDSVFPLMDEIIADKKVHPIKKIRSKLKPFYTGSEYQSKEDYLQYLKQAYGFLQIPMEAPPGGFISFFYPSMKKNWQPSKDIAEELLVRFYIEVTLINELTNSQWERIERAQNPEMELNKIIFKTKFKPDFKEFLKTIPWIVSWDAYGSPGLDLIWRSAPGSELPKKPFGVGDKYLNKLVLASQKDRTYVLIRENNVKIKLSDKDQILTQIIDEGQVRLDSFVGLSKIERDFVVHQHIVIWENPGLDKYKRAPLYKRLLYLRPPRYLCIIKEEALPLEIPYLNRKKTQS